MKDVVKNSSTRSRQTKSSSYSMYFGIVGLIAVLTFLILSMTVLFKIDTVIITGSSIYGYEEIIAASGIHGGDNLVRMIMSKREENIEQQLIYIEKAEMTRAFPSTVEIHIIPAEETINAVAEDNCYILSAEGKILNIMPEPVPDIMTIYGVIPGEENLIGRKFACDDNNRTEIFYRLAELGKGREKASPEEETELDGKLQQAVTQSEFNERIRSFDMTDCFKISCNYDDRINIEFGAMSEFDYKMKLAYNVITAKIGPTTEGTLKMLSNGASFIDKAGLEQNEQIYQENINAATTEETEAETSLSETTASESSRVVHFE